MDPPVGVGSMHSRLIRKKILGHENHAWWWCKKNDCKRHEMAADVGQTENAITDGSCSSSSGIVGEYGLSD